MVTDAKGARKVGWREALRHSAHLRPLLTPRTLRRRAQPTVRPLRTEPFQVGEQSAAQETADSVCPHLPSPQLVAQSNEHLPISLALGQLLQNPSPQ